MADTDTVNKLCANQHDRIRFAVRRARHASPSDTLFWFQPDRDASSAGCTNCCCNYPSSCACSGGSGGMWADNEYIPLEDPQFRPNPRTPRCRRRKASAALRHLLCCGRPGACQARATTHVY